MIAWQSIAVLALLCTIAGLMLGRMLGRAEERDRLRPYVCPKNVPGTGHHAMLRGKCIECGYGGK
jgi:hypothetical protein